MQRGALIKARGWAVAELAAAADAGAGAGRSQSGISLDQLLDLEHLDLLAFLIELELVLVGHACGGPPVDSVQRCEDGAGRSRGADLALLALFTDPAVQPTGQINRYPWPQLRWLVRAATTPMGGAGSKAPVAAAEAPPPAPAPEFGLDVGENLESSLRKLIPLVHAGDTKAQQQAASCLANLAVQDEHQVTIVKQGGLLLLIPLMAKGDVEVQRLAAHAVANLAVNGARPLARLASRVCQDGVPPFSFLFCIAAALRLGAPAAALPTADNRQDIVDEGGIRPLIALMGSPNVEVQRQSTKAIANLAVNGALREHAHG